MAGAALLRSVAARWPAHRLSSICTPAPWPRPPSNKLQPRLWFSSFSAISTGSSTPQPTILRSPPTYNKKVPSGNEWDRFIAGFIGAPPTAAYCLVFGGFTFVYFYVIPTLDHIDAKFDAFNKEMKQQRNERRHVAALDSMGS